MFPVGKEAPAAWTVSMANSKCLPYLSVKSIVRLPGISSDNPVTLNEPVVSIVVESVPFLLTVSHLLTIRRLFSARYPTVAYLVGSPCGATCQKATSYGPTVVKP